MKKVETGVEVMPKGANLPCHGKFGAVDKIELKLKVECDQFQMIEREASWRALRIGMLLIQAKAELKHGEFLPWLEKAVPEFGQRYCYKFMQLAESFMRAKKIKGDAEAYLLCAGNEKPENMDKLPKAVQLAFEFLGDSSLNDLFKKYHIMTPKGGHHPRDPQKPEKLPEDPEKEAITDWTEIAEKLSYHGVEKKTWANLPNMELCKVFDLIDLIHSQMREAVKRVKIVKK